MKRAVPSESRRVAPVALVATAFLTMWQGSAFAIASPPGVVDAVTSPTSSAFTTTTISQEESTTSSSASAEGTAVRVGVADTEVLTISRARGESDGSGCKSDASVLTVVGQEIVGAHAECKPGEKTEEEVGFLQETCAATGGQICLVILYGYAGTSDDEDATTTTSEAAAARACVGGEGESTSEPCTGPVGVGVAESRSETRTGKNGDAEARQSSTVLRLCIGGADPETGKCDGVGVVLLHEDGAAAAGDTEMSEGESYLVGVESQGEDQGKLGQRADVLPGCADEESPPLCLAFNRGNTDADAARTSNSQQAVGLDAVDIISAGLAEGSAAGEAGGKVEAGRASPPRPATGPAPAAAKPPTAALGPLPTTGRAITGLILVGVGLITAGAGLWRRTRWREQA